MPIPGSNILNMALRVIKPQTVSYHRFTGRTKNEIGYDVAQYAAAKDIRGSLQTVPRNLYQQYGLDFNNNYKMFYASIGILDIQRDCSADQITFCGAIFQVLNAVDWMHIDGWESVLCVQISGNNV